MPPKRDLVAEFKRNPLPERMLAIAALAVLLGFLVSNLWGSLFRAWFPTLAFLGSLGIIILVGVDLMNAKILDEPLRTKVLVVLSLLPAVGFAVLVLTVGRPVSARIFDALKAREFPEPASSLTITLLLGLLFGSITQKLGVHALFGFAHCNAFRAYIQCVDLYIGRCPMLLLMPFRALN